MNLKTIPFGINFVAKIVFYLIISSAFFLPHLVPDT